MNINGYLHKILSTLLAAPMVVLPALVHAQSADEHGQSTPHQVSEPSTRWKTIVAGSVRLLLIEHSTRVIFQEKTRRELGGPFFSDYAHSVRRPPKWTDGDGWKVNNIGHPIHGAAAGFIFLSGHTGEEAATPSSARNYWSSRGRAALWAAGYSLQFEIGPVSEASIGNVGMHPGTTGWSDYVMTPVGAFGFMVAEDWLDRHVVMRVEGWTDNKIIRAAVRLGLNPSRSFSMVSQGEMPWYRRGRAF